MKDFRSKEHVIDIVFTLSLFCVFAASALFVVLIGSNVYRSTAGQMAENNSSHTALSYISEKIRQADGTGDISITSLSGTDALALKTQYEGQDYITYIYEDHSELKELFAKADSAVSASSGQSITDITSLNMEEVRDGLYHFAVSTEDGDRIDLYIHPRACFKIAF